MNDQLIESAFEAIASEAGSARQDWARIEKTIRRESFVKRSAFAMISLATIVAVVVVAPHVGTAQRAPRAITPGQTGSLGSDTQRYTDQENRFEVSYPSSWTLSEPKGPGFPLLSSPNAGTNGAVLIGIHPSPGFPFTYHGCQVPSDTENVTTSSSTETIAGARVLRCEQVITQDGMQQHRVTYNIDWTGRRTPGSPSCPRSNTVVPCGDQDSLSFVVAAQTSAAWSACGSTADEIVHTLTWLG